MKISHFKRLTSFHPYHHDPIHSENFSTKALLQTEHHIKSWGNCRCHYQNESQKYKLVWSYIFPCALLFHWNVEKKMVLKRCKMWR